MIRAESASRGQAVVEYILLSVVLVIIATAVLSPLRDRFASIQQDLAVNTFSVVAQDELGIPISWFDIEGQSDTEAKFDGLLSNLGDAGDVPAAQGGGTRPGAQTGGNDGPDSGDNAGDGPGAAAGGPQANARNTTDSDSSQAEGAKGSTTSTSGSGAEDDNAAATGSTRIEGSGGSQGSGSGSEGGTGGAANNDQDKDKAAGTEEAAEEGKEGGASARSKFYDGRSEEERKGGCQNVDWATLLKILAILGVIVVGIIMALSGRGGGKNAKG